MTQIQELSDNDFKITVIIMLTHIVGKKDSKSKDISDSSRSMRINKVKNT